MKIIVSTTHHVNTTCGCDATSYPQCFSSSPSLSSYSSNSATWDLDQELVAKAYFGVLPTGPTLPLCMINVCSDIFTIFFCNLSWDLRCGYLKPSLHQVYLIVVIVGLVVVLFAAIALSFWCCKSSFENP